MLLRLAILTSILLVIGCLPISEYGYYQFLRMWTTAISGIICYREFQTNKTHWVIIFLLIMVLFNPLFPIYLEKVIWQIFDIDSALVFVVYEYHSFRQYKLK